MQKFFYIIIITLSAFVSVNAQTDTIKTNSTKKYDNAKANLPTDLYASLIIAAPGTSFYSSYGHCAVRLQCPSKKLDFCFTYSLAKSFTNEIALFSGTGKGEYAAIEYDRFLKDYEEEGRGVCEYELNLSIEQVRNLWKILNNEISEGAYRRYNYLHTNCSSMSLNAVERSLGNEQIEWKNLSSDVTGTYRNFVNSISNTCPWTGFFWTTLLGKDGENIGNLEDKLAPIFLPAVLSKSTLKTAEGVSRPLLKTNQPKQLSKSSITITEDLFTPTLTFILLIVLSVIISIMEIQKSGSTIVRDFDVLLFTAQTFAGIIIFYISCVSSMVGASYNWNLLILNPLPIILYFAARRRKWYNKLWIVYTAVICLYILLWPLTPQIDFVHALMACVLLVRCATKAMLNNNVSR